MKRSLTSSFLLTVLLTGNVFAQSLSLSTSSVTAGAGDSNFSVFVSLNSDVDLSTLGFRVNIGNWAGSGLTITEYKKAGRTVPNPQTGGINNTNGTVTISVGSLDGSSAVAAGSGQIIEIVLSADASAPAQAHGVTISNINNFYTTGFADVTGSVSAGSTGNITITRDDPDISVSPDSKNYGEVPVGSTESQTFTVSNEGTSALDVSSVSITGTNADQFNITSGGGSFTLAPGSNRGVTVQFAPTSSGVKNAVLVFESNDPFENPKNISLTGRGLASVTITINTSPASRTFTVDGTTYSSAQTFTWVESSTHDISVSSPQSGGSGIQYVFNSWSQGGAQTQTYTVPSGDQTLTANFNTQYYLTVNSSRGNPQGAGWYNSGTSANFSVSSPVDGAAGTRYVFTSWSGDHSGSNPSASVTMNAPKTVTAGWKTQYFLTVNSAHGNPTGAGWHDSGSTAAFGVTTPAAGAAGTRYVFTSWTGDHTGSSASASVEMNAPKAVTAGWQTQYYLSTAANPSAGGSITPAPPGAWYNSGSSVEVNAAEKTGYDWAGWSGDLSGTDRPRTIVMDSPKSVTAHFAKEVQITVITHPAGLEFTVDGTPYSSAQTFTWVEGSTHDISVSSPQSGGSGIQYVFNSWSQGGAQIQTYIVPSVNQTLTANFTTQYYLTVNSPHGNPQGAGWYNSGSTANFSVASPSTGAEGTRYVFTSWSGEHTGSNASASVVMNAPKTVTAGWKTQYHLTVNSAHGNPAGAGWYDSGSTVSFSVTSPAAGAEDIRHVFNSWSGDYSGTNTSGSVTMNSAKTVTASWLTQYFLSTSVNPSAGGSITPAPPGVWYNSGQSISVNSLENTGYQWAGWSGDLSGTLRPQNITMNSPKNVTANFSRNIQIAINTNPSGLAFIVDGTTYSSARTFTWLEGSTHSISVSSPQNEAGGMRFAFSSWSNGGSQSQGYTVPSSNQTLTADFDTQYYLTVSSVRGNPQGAGWYNSGVSAYFSVTSPADESQGTRYVFTSWSGDYIGTHPSASIVMNAPKAMAAFWKTQYFLNINSVYGNPTGGGWYDAGSEAIFSVSSPISGGNGIRYVFLGWTGSGKGAYTGTDISVTVVMNNPIEEHASWQTQYFLNTSVNPSTGGSITPAPPGAWYNSGSSVEVNAEANEGYEWRFWSGNLSGNERPESVLMNSPKSVTANFEDPTNIEDDINTNPVSFEFDLKQNYPNPFNPETRIVFFIDKYGHASLIVYDINGRKVRRVYDGMLSAGRHEAVWHGNDNEGRTVPSGVYFYVLRSGNQSLRMKAVFMK